MEIAPILGSLRKFHGKHLTVRYAAVPVGAFAHAQRVRAVDYFVRYDRKTAMWPFKKHLPIETLDDENHKWTIAEAKGNDGPMIVRFNQTAKSWAKHPALDIRVGFAVPLNQANPEGLPEPEENQQLSLVEDAILSHVRKLGPSVQVLAITTGTFKEFVFYVGNAAGIADVHKQIKTDVTSHEVQCVAERDPKWSVYDVFARRA